MGTYQPDPLSSEQRSPAADLPEPLFLFHRIRALEDELAAARALARRGVTAIVTVGYEDNAPNWRFSMDNLCFLADAVLSMRFAEVDGHVCKFLTVVKVRGTGHSNELREYRITDQGLEVAPHVTNLDALMTGFPKRRDPHK